MRIATAKTTPKVRKACEWRSANETLARSRAVARHLDVTAEAEVALRLSKEIVLPRDVVVGQPLEFSLGWPWVGGRPVVNSYPCSHEPAHRILYAGWRDHLGKRRGAICGPIGRRQVGISIGCCWGPGSLPVEPSRGM